MYNIIFKFVVYLSIITSFFIIILYSGITDENNYYTWTDKNGVTHIEDDLSRIPESTIKKAKTFKNVGAYAWFKNIYTFNETNKIYAVYFLYGLISIFAILILITNIKKNILIYKKEKNNINTQNKIEESGILKLSGNQFREISIVVIEKLGYKLDSTDNYLKNTIEFTANKDGKLYAVSIIFSDNPVSHITVNEIFREGQKFDCNYFVVLTNNIFSEPAIKLGNEFNTVLMDRVDIAGYILKYGLNGK